MTRIGIIARACIWYLDRRGFSITKRGDRGRFVRYRPGAYHGS